MKIYDEAIPTEFWILMYIDCSVRSRAFTFETDTSAWNRFIGKEGANINRIRQRLLEVGYRFEKSARIALCGFILDILGASSTYSVHTVLTPVLAWICFESVTRMNDKGTLAVCFFFFINVEIDSFSCTKKILELDHRTIYICSCLSFITNTYD